MFCKAWLALAGASILLLGPELAPGGDSRRPKLLIEAEELVQPELAKRVRILDVRPWQQYTARHVAGAVWVDFAAWDQASVHGRGVSFWEKQIGALGIERGTPVVIYDNGTCRDAATIWWILRYWGVEDVRLLDAGWSGWLFARKPQQRKVPQVAPRAIQLQPQYARGAAKSDVLKIVQSGQEQLIDVRSNDEIRGIVSRSARAGAIPSARHFDSSECLLQYQNLWRVKSVEDLTQVFKKAQIDPTQPVTIYGQAGDRGGFLAFSLELIGASHVSVYYAGWDEWGNARDTPIRGPRESSEKALTPAKNGVTP